MVDRIHVELPGTSTFDEPIVKVVGWCITDVPDTKLRMWLNGAPVEHELVDRPDIRRKFPGLSSFGFLRRLAPEHCIAAGEGEAVLRFEFGRTQCEKRFEYSAAAVRNAHAWQRDKALKRAWCLSVLRCPACRLARPTQAANGALICPGCGCTLPQTTGALNMLPEDLYRRFQLKPTGNVSSHPYAPEAVALIESTRRAGGKTLDCGAGLRSSQSASVVHAEIVDYESTDVLTVGQSLPFEDACFDSVLSLAVLEHVDDPFTCAAELVRVVKPGGKIFCVVPFLQHEHGYPNHFFNMTRQGLAKLFEGKARILSHNVPSYGAPIHTLSSFLQEYLGQLPPEERASFEKLTIADVAQLKKTEYWAQPFVRALSSEGNWRLASLTAALLVRES